MVGTDPILWADGRMSKWKLTVRFVLERDFEIEKTGENFASYFQVGDWMVTSGYTDPDDSIVNESIFEKPISKWRTVAGKHLHDATLYNIQESGCYDDDVTAPWRVEKIE
jgi:hypothetical protein